MRLMSPADAMFLLPESSDQYMHVGGLEVFELPEGADAGWVRQLYDRMVGVEEVAPLFRQRASHSLATLGAWAWEADPDLDVEHHVRHSALPTPGRVRELLALISRLHGTPLDRHRPLWESHVIEGLVGNRFAVYTKFHHSLMDGVSAMRLLESSLSTDPATRDMAPPWAPRPRPERPSSPGPDGNRWSEGLARAARATADIVEVGPSLARLATRTVLNQTGLAAPPPRTIFNVGITGSRRYAAQTWPLDKVRSVASASGTTVNDVILAMSSSAIRRYLASLDELPDAPLVAMVPISLRSRAQGGGSGNALGVILCNLATDVADPVKRLEVIHDSMQCGKDTLSELTPAQILAMSAVAVAPLVPATLAMGYQVSRPSFNLVISNIPGPSGPLYYDGARLQGMYPLSIPTHGQAMNITVTSYDGGLHFGLTGCRRTVPHLQHLLTHLDTGLSELHDALVT
ncbi:MAG TPA: wax ester/triacylglycerol synthase family O-acyltransferase [Acidimicrobiales bacterium]|jgi:WS/DGAT/MGAT family acyltransferase|nr:wax ester/triacylglycerol synthase family O-acyltransferase [Acidimicrobiales bacterium]